MLTADMLCRAPLYQELSMDLDGTRYVTPSSVPVGFILGLAQGS